MAPPPPPNPCSLQGNGYDWAARVLHSSAFIIIAFLYYILYQQIQLLLLCRYDTVYAYPYQLTHTPNNSLCIHPTMTIFLIGHDYMHCQISLHKCGDELILAMVPCSQYYYPLFSVQLLLHFILQQIQFLWSCMTQYM